MTGDRAVGLATGGSTSGRIAPTGCLVYADELGRYDFGSAHAMGPGRVPNTLRLAASLGVIDRLRVIEPSPLDERLLRTVHTADYIAAVKLQEPDPRYGIGTVDNPIVPGMHAIAGRIAMATTDAIREVWSGRAVRAMNVAGGLHHARPAATSGFCVYNDLAVGLRWLLGQGCERIVYIDTDVHHGDGVQDIFYDDPRVLTISLHETPQVLFPGTGFPTETGAPGAVGSAVNVALPIKTTDADWLRAFHAIVPPVVRAFRPQLILSQHGCDTHHSDPLADLRLTVDGQRAGALAIAALADEVCDGRWVATGGGGYSLLQAVPRTWTHVLSIVAGAPLDPATAIPVDWVEAMGPGAPGWMTDAADGHAPDPVEYADYERDGWDPASRIDQAIRATRQAVFPELGLDPS